MRKELRRQIVMDVKASIELSQYDALELMALLEITVEDLIKAFPHRMVEHAEKFGVYYEAEEEDEAGEDGEGR